MNTKYFAALTTIVLAIGVFQAVTPAKEVVQTRISTGARNRLGVSIAGEGKIDISFLSGKRNISGGWEEDPPPPRTPSPGGSR